MKGWKDNERQGTRKSAVRKCVYKWQGSCTYIISTFGSLNKSWNKATVFVYGILKHWKIKNTNDENTEYFMWEEGNIVLLLASIQRGSSLPSSGIWGPAMLPSQCALDKLTVSCWGQPSSNVLGSIFSVVCILYFYSQLPASSFSLLRYHRIIREKYSHRWKLLGLNHKGSDLSQCIHTLLHL